MFIEHKRQMNKYQFLSTNRDNKLMHKKTQQFSPNEIRSDRKNSERHRDILIPIDKFPRKGFMAGKTIRSEGKPSQKEARMVTFQLLNLKESLLINKQKQTISLHVNSKKKMNTNRMVTEKIGYHNYSAEKKTSVNKILIRGGGYSKQISPERNNYIKFDSDRVWINQQLTQHDTIKEITIKRSLDKRFTPFQRQESKNYQIFFIGNRRIHSKHDFTDSDGDPKVLIGDAIAYKYEIISLLGRGSFGRVLKTFDHKKKEYIAIKIIKNQQKFNIQAKIEIEILETALLHDPKLRNNIVRLKGSFVFRGHTCLKFQILSKNLYQFLKESKFAGFSLDLIRRFAIQILQALLFLSQHKIIHCDLKPENILLKQQNKSGIKVIDVGSGCFQNKQIYTYIQSRFYRAPQIILGVKYSSAIDMWSFGCILIELYTGVPLFPGQNQNEQMTMFMELIGVPQVDLLQKAERRKKFFTDEFICKIPQPKGKEKLPKSLSWIDVVGDDCDPLFIDLITRCLQWNPSKRITPKDALLHEWIISGLPSAIRFQHVEQISKQI